MKQIIKGVRKLLFERLALNGHDDYTIARHFRKQGARIGENCRIAVRNLGSEPYLIKLGNNVVIAPGVSFITHDGACSLFRREIPNLNVFGKIEIGDNCFIGLNAIILYDVTIGANTIIGAGSLVSKDIPPDSVYAGVPARYICGVQQFKERALQRWNALGLKGTRDTWQERLCEYFWDQTPAREG